MLINKSMQAIIEDHICGLIHEFANFWKKNTNIGGVVLKALPKSICEFHCNPHGLKVIFYNEGNLFGS
jgi:hypothetical protein